VAFNPKRDFSRTYKNIPNASIAGLLNAYRKAWPSARKFAKGELDATTRRMVAEKMIGIPQAAYAYDANGDEMGIIAKNTGLPMTGAGGQGYSLRSPLFQRWGLCAMCQTRSRWFRRSPGRKCVKPGEKAAKFFPTMSEIIRGRRTSRCGAYIPM